MTKNRYTKKYILKDALQKIEHFKPNNLDKLIDLLDCSRATFYRVIKTDSKEYQQIFEAIKRQKTEVVLDAMSILRKSKNPTAIITLIKLYGTDEDRQYLNQNINVNANTTVNYEDVKKLEVNINKLSIEEQRMLNALLDKIRDE